MRTRATGLSPGGFRVLTSPKRVKKQSSSIQKPRSQSKTSDKSNGESPQVGEQKQSVLERENSHVDGSPPVSKPNGTTLNNKNYPELHSLKQTRIVYSPVKNATNETKYTNAESLSGSTTKSKTNHLKPKFSQLSPKESITGEKFKAQIILNSRTKMTNLHQVEPVLGKRYRNDSLSVYTTSSEFNENPNPKRIRIHNKLSRKSEAGQLDKSNITPKSSSSTTQDRATTTKVHRRYPMNSTQDQHLSNRKTVYLDSKEPLQELRVKSNSTTSRRMSCEIHQKKASFSFFPEDSSDVESHLKKGMQSIMSRMNKYHYKPLPKNMNNDSSQDKSVSRNKAISSNNINQQDDSNQLTKNQESPREPDKIKQLKPSEDEQAEETSKALVLHKTLDNNQSVIVPNNNKIITGTGVTENLREKRMEVEMLFRSASPNTSYTSTTKPAPIPYQAQDTSMRVRSNSFSGAHEKTLPIVPSFTSQVIPTPCIYFTETATQKSLRLTNSAIIDILRAVAEWALRNPSNLPTSDEIKALLSSTIESPTSRALPLSKVSVATPIVNSSFQLKRIKPLKNTPTTVKRRAIENQKAAGSPPNNISLATDFKCESTMGKKHVKFSSQPENQRIIKNLTTSEAHVAENSTSPSQLETTYTPNQKASNPSLNNGWRIMSTLKNIVASPLKSLGFGFAQDHESAQSVAKEISFDFIPPVTPTPREKRQTKVDRAVTERRSRRRKNTQSSTLRKHIEPLTDRPLRHTNASIQSSARRVVTEKRRFDLSREQAIKKSLARERESQNDTDHPHKESIKPVDTSECVPKNLTANKTSSTDPTLTASDTMEEWPPNLNPNRAVTDILLAADSLPRGPNGEDVATMLCKGWLISPHRDSYVRHVKEKKAVSFLSPRKTIFGVTTQPIPPEDRSHSIDEVKTSRIIDNSLIPVDSTGSQPGRSYGFNYDDESSSDDGDLGNEAEEESSDTLKPSSMQMTDKQFGSSQYDKSSSTNEANISLPSSASNKFYSNNARKPPPFIGVPYTPRIPSSLRNVEALSPNVSSLSTPSTTNSPLAMVKGDDSTISHNFGCDWSSMYEVDPLMAHFDPQTIKSVEDLPKDSFPPIQLPPLNNQVELACLESS
ncbi:Blumeria graminis specific protein/hypothetical protein [Blumeria hordei DH14]|uniref:Uncharacterized protein n=1 Tax=Blumeria graminis f. sp. hordei (strain DH14) TaxID=546991 RepID=N1J689_BLUG1|nr:Blumeria graminis specific protein/hypothetical protein [Blumeria hordei DH14]